MAPLVAAHVLLALLAFLAPRLQQASSLGVVPSAECKERGDHFDTVLQQCSPCSLLDARSVPNLAGAAKGAGSGQSAIHCACAKGLVQCRAGQTCWAKPKSCSGSQCQQAEIFVATRTLECRDCPDGVGERFLAPTQDRTRCLPCHVGIAGDNSSTSWNAEFADCSCPPGFALSERGADGQYLQAKVCIPCAAGMFPGPQGVHAAVFGCQACPDPSRMDRDLATGVCKCKAGQAQGAGFVSAGGICVELSEFDKVNTRFPDSSAAEVPFRDLINDRESWWEDGPFGHYLGIESRGDNTLEVLELDMARSSTVQVTSTAVQWLYVRCAVGCMHGNITACQCLSNLCVAVLYEDQSTICRFTRFLYEGRTVVNAATLGHWKGMPWLFYEPQRAIETREDTSLQWKFTFGSGVNSDTANMLTFWLAKFSLEGAWLGWKKVTSDLELCSSLGGTSSTPGSGAWRRFGSSLVTKCKLPLARLLQCGARPVFYDLFMENVGGGLVPVPVRILNLMRSQDRPNLNADDKDDSIADDVLVRRFTLCDAVIGKEGPTEAYFTSIQPRVFRWAAHMAIQIRTRRDTDAQIYVPVLSIAYAETETDKLIEGAVTDVSFRSEYSMDISSYWVTMTVFIVLLSCLTLALSLYRMLLVQRSYPTMPPEIGVDPGLFTPKPVIQVLTFFSVAFSILFWFHFTMALYWLCMFKLQDTPHTLLPSALHGDEYVPHDAITVVYTCLSFFCVSIGLFRKLRTFVFLVDWETGAPQREGETARNEHEEEQKQALLFQGGGMNPSMGSGYGQQMNQQQGSYGQQMGSGYGGQQMNQHSMMSGSSQFGQQIGMNSGGQFGQYGQQMGTPQSAQHAQMQNQFSYQGQIPQTDFPDRGISAWRSLFILNELNERLTSLRSSSHITWLAMAALLEGCGWKNGARWFPGFESDDTILAARYNPILQFALGTLVWMFVVILQLIVQRIAIMFVDDSRQQFVDVCSVANISVLFLDEPYHGYYIHGKAPTSRGEWCHSELAKALHDEGKGIGFHRGLTPDSPNCQSYEVYLPTDLDVLIPGGSAVKFRHTLYDIFREVISTQVTIAGRERKRPNEGDIAQLSRCRCRLQVLIDSVIHRVMREAKDVIQVQDRLQKFWGTPPPGGVGLLRHPVFYEDLHGVGWSSCLAYGSEVRVPDCGECWGISLPTGFEWHLISFELIIFHMVWRFHGSIFLAVAFAFLLNQVVLRTYALAGRRMLAHTTIINGMFLL